MTKFLIVIFIVVIISSMTAAKVEFCKHTDFSEVCGHSDVITSVKSWGDSGLRLYLSDFSKIASHAFRNLSLPSLQFVAVPSDEWLGLHNRETCSPKIIKLTPRSFAGLSVDNLELECMAIMAEPNPFKKLTSLTSLQLMRVEFKGLLQEFLADFPHLKKLTLLDLNITTISRDMFSGINQNLTTLQVFDKISVIESKSFEKFHILEVLRLREGQLTEVRADMFNGLDQLEYLDLAENGITVLRDHTFSQLAKLKILILSNNKIREIEPETFSGMNLQELDLSDNTLENLPIEVFNNLPNLKILSLRFNNIEIVPRDVFEGLVKLRKLNLNDNKIVYIHSNAFRFLHLNKLNLAHNKLTVLENTTFRGLQVDSLLNLHFNRINEIQHQALKYLKDGKIFICQNDLTTIDRDSLSDKAPYARIIIKDCSDDE